jgi:hypothetical protein
MKIRIVLGFLALILASTFIYQEITSSRRVKIYDPDVEFHVEKIVADLDSTSAFEFKSELNSIKSDASLKRLLTAYGGRDARVLVSLMYDKDYEEITLGDILDNLE